MRITLSTTHALPIYMPWPGLNIRNSFDSVKSMLAGPKFSGTNGSIWMQLQCVIPQFRGKNYIPFIYCLQYCIFCQNCHRNKMRSTSATTKFNKAHWNARFLFWNEYVICYKQDLTNQNTCKCSQDNKPSHFHYNQLQTKQQTQDHRLTTPTNRTTYTWVHRTSYYKRTIIVTTNNIPIRIYIMIYFNITRLEVNND